MDYISNYFNLEASRHHYFFTQMVMPMSTFALAIGHWDMIQVIDKSECIFPTDNSTVPSTNDAHNKKDIEIKCRDIHEPYPCHVKRGDSGPYLPCRIFGPPNLISQVNACDSWKQYIPACLEASYELLGSHPFSKLDLLFLPKCFSGLGLASPSLVFLSQSLFVNEGYVSIHSVTIYECYFLIN